MENLNGALRYSVYLQQLQNLVVVSIIHISHCVNKTVCEIDSAKKKIDDVRPKLHYVL